MRNITLSAIFFCLLPCIALAHDAPVYSIRAVIEPASGSLAAEARIDLPSPEKNKPWQISINGLANVSASFEGKPLNIKPGAGLITIRQKGTLRIKYEMRSSETAGSSAPDNPGVVRGNLISERGIALDSGWYPEVISAGLSDFSLKAVLPSGFIAISEADEITTASAGDRMTEYSFIFPHAVDSITLVAGRYEVKSIVRAGVEVYAYFFPQSSGLAEDYLTSAAEAIETYQKMLGPYPYKRFSVVENTLPTGYSMPTYTLLGSSVVRLPFISKTSLWHEVLHQWFGNSVFMAEGDGNWAEGLTAYLADHRIDEAAGDGPGHRKRLLLDYRNYVSPSTDFPIRRFVQRSDRATRSIGYGKSAMFFHMLRRDIGDEYFASGLRLLVQQYSGEEASWDDLRLAFEKASGRDLSSFFSQWLGSKGHPVFGVRDAAGVMLGGKHKASFVIEQQGALWNGLAIPVRVRSEAGEVFETVRLTGKITLAEIETPGRPLEIILDPEYDIFRALLPEEAPAVISALLGAESRIVISSEDEAYAPALDALKGLGFKERKASEVTDAELRGASVVILGQGGMIANMLFGQEPAPEPYTKDGFSLSVYDNPYSSRRAIGFIRSSGKDESERAAQKLSHYGRYSRLGFSSGRNTLKETAPSIDGMRIKLYEPPRGIETARTMGLDAIMDRLASFDVVYVGERHDRYEDHKLQLEVLAGLKARGYRIALGMEMFESSVQNALDAYVKGETSEERMLLDSNYFDAWGMNWHLYRELVDFGRTNNIPVLGLNQREAVVKKISRSGLDALSKDERTELPEGLDLTDRDYTKTLREIFTSHGPAQGDFTNFAQAQIVRDERMAESIAGFMRANPGVKVVVAAGQGHVVYGHGIPKRLARRIPHKYAVVMNAESADFDPAGADYIVSMQQLSAPQTPMLGIVLKDSPEGVVIDGASPGSLAARAGLVKGDIIISADGREIKKVSGLKALMFSKRPGERLRMVYERKRWLLGPLRVEVELALE